MSLARAQERDGRKLWIDPEVEEFVDILTHGHAGIGWEGDAMLGLFRVSGDRWEIARFEQGRYKTVCISKPHAKLNLGIIISLMDHDLQRRSAQQLFDAVEKHNVQLQKEIDDRSHGQIEEALIKAYWGAAKDIGHHY